MWSLEMKQPLGRWNRERCKESEFLMTSVEPLDAAMPEAFL